jgi:hypothetical protein
MKEFIISILNLMGFGVNAVVMGGGDIFVKKLGDYVPDVTLSISYEDTKSMIVCVNAGKPDSFRIVYGLQGESRRVVSIDIED